MNIKSICHKPPIIWGDGSWIKDLWTTNNLSIQNNIFKFRRRWRRKHHFRTSNSSRRRSVDENVKISISPKNLLEAKKKPYWDENLTIAPLYTNLLTKFYLDDCKALCVKKFMQRHEKPDVVKLIEYLIPKPHDLNKHYSNLSQDYIKDFQLLVTIDTVLIHEFLVFSSIARSVHKSGTWIIKYKVLTMGPKYKHLNPSPLDRCKVLCVNLYCISLFTLVICKSSSQTFILSNHHLWHKSSVYYYLYKDSPYVK